MKSSHKPQVYQCPECGLHYDNEELAKQCEAWCEEHKSCNFLIEQQSVEARQLKAERAKGG